MQSSLLYPPSNLTFIPAAHRQPYQNPYTLPSQIPPMHRRNATKENTAPLKIWLKQHLDNPYPSKQDKLKLAVSGNMTLTQVSTWFANARRRIKKEGFGIFMDNQISPGLNSTFSDTSSVTSDEFKNVTLDSGVEKSPVITKKKIWSVADML